MREQALVACTTQITIVGSLSPARSLMGTTHFSCARRWHDLLSIESRTAPASVVESKPDKVHPPQSGQAAHNGVRHLPPSPLLALPLPDRRLPRHAPSHPRPLTDLYPWLCRCKLGRPRWSSIFLSVSKEVLPRGAGRGGREWRVAPVARRSASAPAMRADRRRARRRAAPRTEVAAAARAVRACAPGAREGAVPQEAGCAVRRDAIGAPCTALCFARESRCSHMAMWKVRASECRVSVRASDLNQ